MVHLGMELNTDLIRQSLAEAEKPADPFEALLVRSPASVATHLAGRARMVEHLAPLVEPLGLTVLSARAGQFMGEEDATWEVEVARDGEEARFLCPMASTLPIYGAEARRLVGEAILAAIGKNCDKGRRDDGTTAG